MSNEEEKRCPLCAEEMDTTDQQFKPCHCGYQMCVWCWHHIMDVAEKEGVEGQCPACRTPYDKKKIAAMEANVERVVANNLSRKNKPPKAKPKANEVRKVLTNVRVIQRKMAYVIGLPLSLADEDLLQRKEYFGQYGKVYKVALSRTAGGTLQQFVNETCSVYITYSKEEEAIRCIQAVHGFLLKGRLLRASLGTAKYCHAWLKNMSCNNTACLYLHSIGAEDDSFSKDEEAAVHTRNRVEEVAGAHPNSQWRSGNVLPPPLVEPTNTCSTAANKPVIGNAFENTVHMPITSGSHFPCLVSPKDEDGGVRAPSKMRPFADIVGRSCSTAPEKDGNVTDERRNLNLCSEFSSVNIDTDDHVEAEYSDVLVRQVSNSSHLLKETNALKKADLTPNDATVNKEQSCFMFDSGRQLLNGPCSTVREDLSCFDNQMSKDCETLGQVACLFPSSFPARNTEDSSGHTWWHRESSSSSGFYEDHSSIDKLDDAPIKSRGLNVTLNNRFNEKKFPSSAKSDRIYRGSNSFSDEEILEHLRRLDDDNITNDDQRSATEAVESSIISNILSIDFDACGDSLTIPRSSGGLCIKTARQRGSSQNFQNSDKSGPCSSRLEGFASQITNLDCSLHSFDQMSKNYSVLQGFRENKEQQLSPHHHGVGAQSLTSPGLATFRQPPPGFSSSERTEVLRATSRDHLAQTSLQNNYCQAPSTGNISNSCDADIVDPAILFVGQGYQTYKELNNSGSEMQLTYASQPSSFEDEARLWLSMQQPTPAHQEPNLSKIYMQQTPFAAHQELRHSGRIRNGVAPLDDVYSISSSLMTQQQTYNSSSFARFPQRKYANGHISNGYLLGSDESQRRSEVSMAGLQKNERLGFNRFYSGYGDLMLQTPHTNEVKARVFGM